MKTHGQRRKREFSRLWYLESLKERLPVVIVGAVVFLAGGALLVFTTSGIIGIGLGARSAEDRVELLAEGDCAVRAGEPLGRIIGELGVSRGAPRRRYQVALLDEQRVIQVNVDEVEVVDCPQLEP